MTHDLGGYTKQRGDITLTMVAVLNPEVVVTNVLVVVLEGKSVVASFLSNTYTRL